MKTLSKIFCILVIFIQPIFAVEEAIVNFSVGKISVKNSGNPKENWRIVKKGDKVQEGETIMTGNGSSVTLIYNGSEFKVFANSTMILKDLPTKDKSGNADVTSGFAWFKMENLGKSGFKANTPASTAGVRGTAFATMYDVKSKTAMNCICHGKVEVNTAAQDGAVLLEQGNGSAIVSGNPKVDKTSYKDDFQKGEMPPVVLPSFEKKIKAAPILKNCLSCHKTKDWKVDGTKMDETYGK